MHLSIHCFGGFRATLDNQPLPVSRARKIEALLAYLVAHTNHPQSRTELALLFYPDLSEKAARANLRQNITRLRRILKDKDATPSFLITDQPETIQFNQASAYSADIHQFEQKSRGCLQHEDKPTPTCSDCMALLQEATALYAGSFLTGFSLPDSDLFDRWLARQRQRYEQMVLFAWEMLATHFAQRSEHARAYHYVEEQLALAPWRETAYGQGMRLLARQGKRAEALALYQRCVFMLEAELGIRPMPETQALAERIETLGEKRRFSLPGMIDTFVGRRKEIGDVLVRLTDPAGRLITLVGPGGIGKTQLALQVGRKIADDYFGPFMDGVFFIPAGNTPLTSSLPLINHIMDALGLPLPNHMSPNHVLRRALRDKECLLIFDNGEYLDRVGRRLISEIVQHAPTVQILVTSRERLHLSSEWIIELDGLPYPLPPAQQHLPARPRTSQDWQNYAAVQLFIQRAKKTQDTFSPTEQVEGIITTCQLVRGLPLALELAATWVRVLPCNDIAERIRQTADSLATRLFDWPERHRSMRIVFENSWALLPPAGQALLPKLTLFQGAFTLEAAQEVVAATVIDMADLVDRSLIKSRPGVSAPLFELHPLLRQFASEKQSPENSKLTTSHQPPATSHQPPTTNHQPLATKHADYYAFLLEQLAERTHEHHTASLQRIQEALPNVRVGWQWAIDNADFPLISRYMPTLYSFYMMRGWRHEGREMFQKALVLQADQPELHQMPPDIALVITGLLTRVAGFDYEIGLIDEAQSLIQTSLQISHRVEDPGELALGYKRLGEITHRRGDYAQALKLLQFSLQISEEHATLSEVAHRRLSLGAVYRDMGQLEEAQTQFERAVSLARQADSGWGLAHALRLLSTVTYQLGEVARAEALHREGLQLSRAIDDKISEALALLDWGNHLRTNGTYSEAEPLFLMALQLLEDVPYDKGIAFAHYRLGQLMSDLERCEPAQTAFYDAFEKAVATQDLPLVLQILLDMVRLVTQVCVTDSMPASAVTLLRMVADHPAGTPQLRQQANQLLTDLNVSPSPSSYLSLQDVQRLVATVIKLENT